MKPELLVAQKPHNIIRDLRRCNIQPNQAIVVVTQRALEEILVAAEKRRTRLLEQEGDNLVVEEAFS
jgi:hypothetical protein